MEQYLTASGEDDLGEAYWDSLLREVDEGGEGESREAYEPAVDEGIWREAEESLSQGEVWEVKVAGYNRGGLLVDWKGIIGFLPLSHLEGFPSDLDVEERQKMLASWVGETLQCKIIEVDRERERLLFSQRALGWEGDPEKLWEELTPGEVRRGRVIRLCSFGAFVDLGGFDGLLHISELSWHHVERPEEVLKIGQEIEVYILDVDRERKRVALSLKRLQSDPWAEVAEKYHIGQVVEGVISSVVDFGAFACIEEGVEGLIHLSELAEGDFLHPHNVVQEGEVVKVRILNIDPQRRRMALSLRKV